MSQTDDNPTLGLVADVGGTNIRLALATADGLAELRCFRCADFISLEAVIRHYLESVAKTPDYGCIAIAGPISGDRFQMTNLGWSSSIRSLESSLGLARLWVINDYTAIAMSLPSLGGDQLLTLRRGEANGQAPMMVCGPGTGLGAAQLVPVKGRYHPVSGEGGHVDFAPVTPRQQQLHQVLARRFGHVSVEQLLSGPGLENIYQALVVLTPDASVATTLPASEITDGFIEQKCTLCIEAVNLFCQVLAQAMANMALTTGALGGMYIAGGIMPRLVNYLDIARFGEDFINKGRFRQYLAAIPVYLVTEPQPGLIGAAAYLRQEIEESENE